MGAKVGGSFYYVEDDGNGKAGCIGIQKTKRSPGVQAYFESDEWQAINYGDYLLYAAANQSLDLTIDRLGKNRFDEALRLYRHAQQTAQQVCAAETYFPCSFNGTIQVDLS